MTIDAVFLQMLQKNGIIPLRLVDSEHPSIVGSSE